VEVRQEGYRAFAVTTERERDPGTGHVRDTVLRGFRNGLAQVPYEYQARRYPWAQKALALAEREHGKPVPVCSACGGRLISHGAYGRCAACAA
jgi:hypothetical protein